MSKKHRFLLGLLGVPCLLLLASFKIAQGRPHLFTTYKSQVSGFYFPNDGKSVCPSIEGPTKCYDKNTRKRVPILHTDDLRHHGPFYFKNEMDGNISYEIRGEKAKSAPSWLQSQAVFSPDKRVVTLASGNEVKRWDFQQKRFLWQTHFESPTPDPYGDVVVEALSPDGTLCVVVRNDDSARINWIIGDCRTGKVVAPLKYPEGEGHPHDFSFSPDGRTLRMMTDVDMYFLDSFTARVLWETDLDDGAHYTSSGLVGIPSTNGFNLFDTRTGKSRLHFDVPVSAQIQVWNLSLDGKQLWWATPDNKIFWRDLD